MTDRVGVLLMAYGSPRHPDEIEAYYTDIRRGRPPTPELLAGLVARYEAIGGVSPLPERTEAQRARLQQALDARQPGRFDVVLGLKHAAPTIEDGVAALAERGLSTVVALVLAPHFSAGSIGQYLGRASASAAEHDLDLRGVERWGLLPAYVAFETAAVQTELAGLPDGSKVVFTAHSLPLRVVTQGDPYADEVRGTAEVVAARAGLDRWGSWSMAWQSAGRTADPWLGPDILEVIDDLARAEGATGVLVCACGFVADHLEVLYDLDIEARGRAEARGLAFARTACVNDDPTVFAALADLVVARAGATTEGAG